MKDISTTLQNLRKTGLKWTPQRFAVLEVLEGNTSHPSADMIYEKVKQKYPMISFATVYKTLKVLEEIGEIQQLTISENKVHFDPNTHPHHHFFCRTCRNILDIFPEKPLFSGRVDGHRVDTYQVFLYGVCSKCRDSN